jgi:probable phosphoglycerate mutase
MGALEGKSLKELGALKANGAETNKDFVKRGVDWWKTRILGQVLGSETRNVLVTSHGGLITSLVRGLLASGEVRCAPGVRVGKCVNASVTIIEVDANERGTLVTYAETAHLTSAALESNADEVAAT